MDLRSIFIANGVGVFILLILLYVSRAKILRNTEEDRVYTIMVLGVMLACFMEALSYAIDGVALPGLRALNYAANTYLYCVNILLPFCVIVYVDLGLYGDARRIRQHYKPQMAIGIIMIAVNALNFFVPVTYYISDANVYERKPFSYAYYVVILYYLITAVVLTRRYERENGTRAFFRLWVFILPIMVGAGLQFAFYGLSMAWVSSAIGLVGLFMMQQNELAYIDVLVGIYNRQYFNHVVTAWITRGVGFCGILLDVDRFKRINDELGHSQGDAALKAVADLLKQSRQGNELVFRYAGDEFVVLKMSESPDAMSSYVENLERNLAAYNQVKRPYRLELSYGAGFCDDGDIDSFVRQMDTHMYQMKEEHHSGAPRKA